MDDEKPEKIGRYKILRLIATGGMGEIYLAYDPLCERKVALKIIKNKLLKHKSVRKRFVNEAKLASQLSHPSIIPIYVFHEEEDLVYYTMPYIEGETLKDIIKATRKKEDQGQSPHPIGVSIPALIRIFLTIAQATSFAYSHGILHRDLKPENILVGKFGEVIIIDWGIAERTDSEELILDEDLPEILKIKEDSSETQENFTSPGKVVGTVNFMAPERALGQKATIRSEIYSLGVILYQLLTLHLPFKRGSLKEFYKKMDHEKLIEPQEMAPHRDISPQLSKILSKSLEKDPKKRYTSIKSMISDIEEYIEGHPEWIKASSLQIENPDDWEFQENIVIAKHMALTTSTQIMEWVMLMISKEPFYGNTRVECNITLNDDCDGTGFLISIPHPSERKGIEDGYCLWIGSKKNPSCKLFRSNVEVLNIPDVFLTPHKIAKVCIEKIDNTFILYIDGVMILNYVSHLPLTGTHVGLLYRNREFVMDELKVSLGSQSVMINCLSVPDAFLASKNFEKALQEYRRIGHSFKGRFEGREAIFRAGITLLEEAKKDRMNRQNLYNLAFAEFEKLHNTPGAPLEYLGKSLIYKAENDLEEEIKSLSIGLRKFPRHPLKPILEEHVAFRLHETSKKERIAGLEFTLLALRHIPSLVDNQELLPSLAKTWKDLHFILVPDNFSSPYAKNIHFAFLIAFLLKETTQVYEMINTIPQDIPERELFIGNALFALMHLGQFTFVEKIREELENPPPFTDIHESIPSILKDFKTELSEEATRLITLKLEMSLEEDLEEIFATLKTFTIPKKYSQYIKELEVWNQFLTKKEPNLHLLDTENSDLSRVLSTCHAMKTKGTQYAISFLKDIIYVPYPPVSALLLYEVLGHIKKKWHLNAFTYEKIQLYRQLHLLNFLLDKTWKMRDCQKKLNSLLKEISLDFV